MSKPRVLIVDDNEPICVLLTALLREEFTTELAGDGHEAIEKLKTTNFAAVLLDLKMPGSDGFTVLEFLEREKPHALARVLVVTAALAPSEIERAQRYGICGIVRKPFAVESMLQAVRDCTGESGEGAPLPPVFCAGPALILMLADLLKQRF